jgi:beta-barrel assembly-enhancing protease
MKKLIVLICFLIYAGSAYSQTWTYSISGVVKRKISILGATEKKSDLEIGEKVTLLNIQNNATYGIYYIVLSEGVAVRVSISDLKKIEFEKPKDKDELWKVVRINSGLDEYILSKGYQYEMRNDLEDETIEALQNLEKYYGFFKDEYLEDYVQSLFYKIHSITLNDGRPGNLTVKILKSSAPNAFSMPDGTVIITTGLLSTIRSEDELIGVLAHEVAHFVLDHQIVNINKAITRQKRAEFWVGFTTVVAAASEAYITAKNDFYPDGNLTAAANIISSSIANSINERIGATYNNEQELEADNAAGMVLTFLNRDPKALSAALTRIFKYSEQNGDYLALSGSGTHPSLSGRITKIGKTDPNKFNNIKYDQVISVVNTYNSISEYDLRHLETSLYLSSRNIESGVGTEDDYILKAMTIRLLYDSPEKNQEALDLINKAKVLNIAPHNYIFKQEGLTLIRLGRLKEAGDAFKTYLKNLENEKDNSGNLFDEIDWTKKMINKVSML